MGLLVQVGGMQVYDPIVGVFGKSYTGREGELGNGLEGSELLKLNVGDEAESE